MIARSTSSIAGDRARALIFISTGQRQLAASVRRCHGLAEALDVFLEAEYIEVHDGRQVADVDVRRVLIKRLREAPPVEYVIADVPDVTDLAKDVGSFGATVVLPPRSWSDVSAGAEVQP